MTDNLNNSKEKQTFFPCELRTATLWEHTQSSYIKTYRKQYVILRYEQPQKHSVRSHQHVTDPLQSLSHHQPTQINLD